METDLKTFPYICYLKVLMSEEYYPMWDEGKLRGDYIGRFDSYQTLVEESSPDIIYLNGAPEDEIDDRSDWSLLHESNLIEYGNMSEHEIHFFGPEEELSKVKGKMRHENLPPTMLLDGQKNRLEEYKELRDNIDGDEKIHFIGSDYTIEQDRILQEHFLPNIQAEFIGAETGKDSSTERIKRRLYAEALKLADRF